MALFDHVCFGRLFNEKIAALWVLQHSLISIPIPNLMEIREGGLTGRQMPSVILAENHFFKILGKQENKEKICQ